MFKIYTKLYFEEPFLNFSLLWAMGMRWWQAASKYIHRASNYSSMSISNMIGPVEQMALVKHPVKGLYFMTLKVPQVKFSKISYIRVFKVSYHLITVLCLFLFEISH